MSESSLPVDNPPAARRPVGSAIALAIALVLAGVVVAPLGFVMTLVVFNGCYGASSAWGEVVVYGWLMGVWPLALLVNALTPPALLWRGRGWKWAAGALLVGSLACAGVFIIGLFVVGAVVC